jgi:S1-C subfamily serine protease
MHRLKSIPVWAALVVAAWLSAGCSHIARHIEGNATLSKDADTLEARFNHDNFWDRPCAVGIFVRYDGLILGLSENAMHAGLRQGDQIASVESHAFEDSIWFSDAMRQHAAGDVLHVSVVRDGRTKDTAVECVDLAEVKQLDRALLAALRSADRDQCLRIIGELNLKSPPNHARMAVEFDCRYSDKTVRQSGVAGALAVYTLSRTYLEEVTKDRVAFEEARPRIIETAELLRAGYANRELASTLEQKLKDAEVETYGGPGKAASARPAPAHHGKASGTGFAVSADGTILTSAHVVADATDIVIVLGDGSSHPAKVLQLSGQTDLAVLKIDAATPDYLELGSTASLKLGDKVFTIGFPTPNMLGVKPKYSEGAVAALSGLADEAAWMQVSIPIQPGNSGGPVVDGHGHVVGIVKAVIDPAIFFEHYGQLPQNVNWAVKADYAIPLLASSGVVGTPAPASTDATDLVTKAVCFIRVSF